MDITHTHTHTHTETHTHTHTQKHTHMHTHTHTHNPHTVRWSDWSLCGEYFPNLEIPTRVTPVESIDQTNRSICDKTKTMGLETIGVVCGALFS